MYAMSTLVHRQLFSVGLIVESSVAAGWTNGTRNPERQNLYFTVQERDVNSDLESMLGAVHRTLYDSQLMIVKIALSESCCCLPSLSLYFSLMTDQSSFPAIDVSPAFLEPSLIIPLELY